MEQVEEEKRRMHLEKQRQQRTAEVRRVLDWVHRKSTPWAWVHGFVMKRVHMPVEEGT